MLIAGERTETRTKTQNGGKNMKFKIEVWDEMLKRYTEITITSSRGANKLFMVLDPLLIAFDSGDGEHPTKFTLL